MHQGPWAGDVQDHLEPEARPGIPLRRRRSHPSGTSCILAQGVLGRSSLAIPGAVVGTMAGAAPLPVPSME